MTLEPWHLGAAAVFALAHFVLAVFAFRQFSETPQRTEFVDSDTVECPECGVSNNIEYRFCQECVTELPGQHPSAGPNPSPTGGRLLN